MRARSTHTAALLGCALCCAQAAAQTAPANGADVELSIPDCDGISGAEIAKLVELELGEQKNAEPAGATSGGTRASVQCAAERATITVADTHRASPLVLELALDTTPPEARARFLALAVAELIATSRLEHADARAADNQPEPRAATPAPASSEPAPPAPAPHTEHRFELFLQGGAARAFEPALFAPALAAGALVAFHPFALIGDVAYERGRTRTSDAAITTHTLSLSLTPAWRVTLQRWTLSFALGLRGGYALLSASPRKSQLEGHDVTGLFLAPVSDASLQLALNEHWALRIALELGYVIKPVRGLDPDQAKLLELTGLRTTALLGIACAP